MGALFDLIAPLRCVACAAPSDGDVCETCAEKLEPIGEPMCPRCGTPDPLVRGGVCAACEDLTGFGRARSLVRYGGPAARLTLALKRHGRAGLASAAGTLLADVARRDGFDRGKPVVVFVPPGPQARRRGFDHAELLARGVARALDLRLVPALARVAGGRRQADVSSAERHANAFGRFIARPLAGRAILIDDVFTTGATAEACGLALLEAGASGVDVLTWARTIRTVH